MIVSLLLYSGAILMAGSMLMTASLWADAITALLWIAFIRPRSAFLALGIYGVVLMVWTLSALLLVHSILISCGVLFSLWLTPLLATPAVNAFARWRDKGRVARIPAEGEQLKLTTYIFDAHRARLRRLYQPPPVF